ncbi:MAG: hypothetical protein IJJ26_03245 [Victivallales bacterium]|nr:hypothetical protein [Victivallales bacterium]
MKKLLCALSLFLNIAMLYARTIPCEGLYTGHLQGIATDGKHIFWSFTTTLVKTDMEGKLVKKVQVPRHSGDPCLLNGKLYIPVNRGKFNKPKGASKDSIEVYDAETLELRKTVEIPECDHGAGAIGTFQNHIWLTGGLPDDAPCNIILEFTEELEFVKRHECQGYTKMGIQTMKRMRGLWWCGVYDKPASFVCDDNFTVLVRNPVYLAVGMAELPDGTILVARTKRQPNPDNPDKKLWSGRILTATYDEQNKTIVLDKQ